jgi:hypothetical protein
MDKVYCIKPLEKKSISWRVEMYRENEDGSISWFNMEELYRWGQGFVEADMDSNLPYKDSTLAYCKTNVGWGCEFEDSINIDWEFSDDISELDQQEIKELYYEGGAGWLFDGEHDWQTEDDYVIVLSPFQIDLCDDDGTIIEENIELKERPPLDKNAAWPFS